MLGELEFRLQSILARELGMPPAAVKKDQSFPELGLDSMMAMTLRREAKQLVGFELSSTMLWNHPTVASLAEYLTEVLAQQRESGEVEEETPLDPVDSVLDELFDSVESIPAGSESGI
jgi:acyl carrier protein